MAEAEVVRPLAAVGTQPAPNPHVSPRLNGDLARLVTSDLPEPSVDHRPGPVLSSHGPLPPLGSSVDLPPRVVSDVQPGPAAGTVNGIIHAPPHSTVSPGAGPRSGSTSQPASKGSSPHIASRSSTPTVESVQACPAHPINLRWREPQTLQYATPGGPAPGPAHSTHATPSYSQFGSNTQSQYISPPHSGPEATGRGSTPGSGHQPSHARYPGGLQAPPPPPPPPPPPAPAQQFPYQKPPPYLGQSPSKPIIMDPPSVRNRPPPTNGPAAGFASPTRDYARESTKFVDDCTRLNFAVQQSVPEAVRRILRDNWEKCLLGSDFHQAFILNAAIHHSSPSITRRAVADFGKKMVSDCRDDVIRHFNTSDLDAVADYVVSMASEAFLDKCLEKRLLTIEAKPLINALARAERLGYEQSDIIDLKSQQEQVIPYPGHQARQGPFPSSFPSPVPPPPPPPSHSAPPPAYPPSTPVQHAPVGAAHPAIPAPPQQSPELEGKDSKGREVMQCVRCYRTFVYVAAYQHHIEKNVCTRLPPSAGGYRWACDLCGAPFATAGGLHYHAANKVCLNAPSVSPPAGPPASLPGVASIFPTNGNPPSTPDFRGSVHKIVAAIKPSPAHESSPAPSPIPGDPYAHLTPEAMTSMNQELREAEQKFAGRFQEAERIPDPDERRVKLDGLKNSFGTKQSMIRKKYGVRLRERRTKAEIAAEKARMGIGQNESAPPKPPTTTPATTGATTTPSRSGWTAANITPPTQPSTLQENGAKRRRLDETGASAASTHGTPQIEELPRKVPSMSAISTSSAAAAPVAAPLRDPPLPPPRPPQSSAHAGENIEHPRPELSPPVSLKDASAAPSRPSVKEEDTQATDPDSDSEIEDIPATLPSHIRQTLVQSAS